MDDYGDQLANSFVGTFEYIAPEIIQYEGYAGSVDWWAFGILLYEMVYGKTPFKGKDNDDTLSNTYLGEFDFPDDVNSSKQIKDLLKKLLAHDVEKRLASPSSIRSHPFFESVNWPLIRHMEPPYVPKIDVEKNFRHFDDFVDSDEEYNNWEEKEEKEQKEKEEKEKEEEKKKKKEEETEETEEKQQIGGGKDGEVEEEEEEEEEEDIISPGYSKSQDLSFPHFEYVAKYGERHWDIEEGPTVYGAMDRVRSDHMESPTSKAKRSTDAKV